VYEHVLTEYSKKDSYYIVELAKDDADRPSNSNDWKQVKHLSAFLEVFYILHLFSTSYVTFNLVFFEFVAIHTMLKHLEKVVETIDANNEESEEIEEIRSRSQNLKK